MTREKRLQDRHRGLRGSPGVCNPPPHAEKSSVNLGMTGKHSWKRPGERNSG